MTDHAKHWIDAVSLTTMVGTLVELLPAFAAIVSIVWGCIRIYETKTVQKLLKKDHNGD